MKRSDKYDNLKQIEKRADYERFRQKLKLEEKLQRVDDLQ